MTVWKTRSERKPTGGKIGAFRQKRRFEGGQEFLQTSIGTRKAKPLKTYGGGTKQKLQKEQTANVFDPKSKKTQKSKIVSVSENKADTHYVRRNIITKGAIIKTEAGLVRVTSRPGQSGMINGILLDKK